MARMTGGQAIVRTIKGHGIDTLFGVPGIQLDPLFDALYEERQSVRTIATRHEQGAAFMALGFAQSTGRVGAFAAVPGPGVLNAGAALCTAQGSNVPVLCLTGQIPSYQIGLGLGIPHELIDQERALSGIVPWVARADAPTDAPALLAESFRRMLGGRHQPAAFAMAPDIMAKEAEIALAEPVTAYPVPEPDEAALEVAARLLGAAESPAIFVGGGIFGAEAELLGVAELLEAPVVMTRTGRGALSDRHHLAHGMVGGQRLWDGVDVALVVGTRFLAPAHSWGREGRFRIVRIDIDPIQAGKPVAPDACLITRAARGLALLAERIPRHNRRRPSRRTEMEAVKRKVADDFAQVEPQHGYARVIRDEVPEDGFIVTDVTQMATFVQYATPVFRPRTLITSGFQAALGFAFPAALGVKVANPDRAVVAVHGDGGFMFAAAELATAVANNIATVTIVFNDNAYGNVKRGQKASYGGRIIAADLHNPDFVKLAESFGAAGYRAAAPDALRHSLREAFAARAPAVIEVPFPEVANIYKTLVRRPHSTGVAPG